MKHYRLKPSGMLVFVSSLFFFFPPVKAQLFEGGMMGGITGSQVDGDNYGGYHKLNLAAGVYVRLHTATHRAIQMEIKYEGKGAAAYNFFDPNRVTPNDMYRLALQYVEIPLLWMYDFHPRFSFHLGLQPAYLFKGTVRDQYGDVFNVFDYADFRKFEMAGLTGLSYRLNPRIEGWVRFSYSITPIMQYEGGVATRPWFRNLYNNGIGLCVYYRLDQ